MQNIILFDKCNQVIDGLKLTPDQMVLLNYFDNKDLLVEDIQIIYDINEFFKEVR